jgi:hypothetical protein
MEMESQPAGSLMGVVLLGWMEREQALTFLLEDCVFEPPLTEPAAESLWREWRERAAGVPERTGIVQQLPLGEAEQEHAGRFAQFLAGIGVAGTQVVKVDPLQMVVGQYHVVTERSGGYAARCGRDADWWGLALPTAVANPDLEMNFVRRSYDTDIDIELPHSEFIFGLQPQGGFGPRELLPYVSALKVGERLVLTKGYHRLYARVSMTEGRLPERLSLLALDVGTLDPPKDGKADASEAGLDIFGARPALLADYFTEGLAMPVFLRRKLYRLEVRARLVARNA